ncbi:PTS sugar transporter subunit IIA [Tepidanaerobacter syntrophicus]|uniref:PTS sugar transporter subunit IIA n=1 Tax=Tepidanaerobacter syntrophicus TaxID=224999 RepID=UPI001BD4652D|nr:hypothetical protein [Tepidanaerobacter syntrophicus]
MNIIIVSHGYMAEGVLSAAKMILGDCENIYAYDLAKYDSPSDIAKLLEKPIKKQSDTDFIVFCDIHGGSVHNKMTELCKYQNVYIVGGLTLSMVLECQLKKETMETRKLIDYVVKLAKESISIISHKEAMEKIKTGMEDDNLW